MALRLLLHLRGIIDGLSVWPGTLTWVFFESASISEGVDGVVGARTPRGNTGDHYYADAVIAAVYVLYEGVAEDHGQLARSEGDVDIWVILAHVETSDALLERQ